MNLRFESYVISYRTKTSKMEIAIDERFESYVISYRTKTASLEDSQRG